jgi:hypothetical protein
MKLEEEPPIFSKQKVNFSPTDRITHLAVSNELLVLAMANNILLRIDLRQPNNPQGNDGSLLLLSFIYCSLGTLVVRVYWTFDWKPQAIEITQR